LSDRARWNDEESGPRAAAIAPKGRDIPARGNAPESAFEGDQP